MKQNWNPLNILRWNVVSLVFLPAFLCITPVWGDVVATKSSNLEGRILENSSQVVILETVAGEYIVVRKDVVVTIQQEPLTEFYFRRGHFYESKGDDNRALLDYMEAVNLNAEHKEAKAHIEAIHYKRKKAQWDQNLNSAQQLISSQQFRGAIETYQKVLDMEPDDQLARQVVQQMSDTYAKLAFVYYDHCYDEGAIRELARAEELNPNNADIFFVLGKIHESDRKWDLARLEYERAIELDPNHSSARNNLMNLIERTRGKTIE
jgi:tetratricopeptide (TPR) repeat protein